MVFVSAPERAPSKNTAAHAHVPHLYQYTKRPAVPKRSGADQTLEEETERPVLNIPNPEGDGSNSWSIRTVRIRLRGRIWSNCAESCFWTLPSCTLCCVPGVPPVWRDTDSLMDSTTLVHHGPKHYESSIVPGPGQVQMAGFRARLSMPSINRFPATASHH